ncbi:MAG: hypothetical protein ABEK84_04145, partial [Salinibacter sp.]
ASGLSSFYEAFPPEEACRPAQRLEIHYTPEHGSWLNMAEIGNSAMARPLQADSGETGHGRRNVSLVRSAQRSRGGSKLALSDRGCTHQTSTALPKH